MFITNTIQIANTIKMNIISISLDIEKMDAVTLYNNPTEENYRLYIENNQDIHVSNRFGTNLLHYACIFDIKNMIKRLIELGIDVNSRDKDGNTALHIAVYNNCYDITEILLGYSMDVDAKNIYGDTPKTYLAFRDQRFKDLFKDV